MQEDKQIPLWEWAGVTSCDRWMPVTCLNHGGFSNNLTEVGQLKLMNSIHQALA